MKIYTFILLLVAALFISACDVINPAEPVPAYLQIDNFDFTVQTGQGSASHKITDAWVYVNGDFLGAYTLPATVPIIASGSSEILIDPGIKDNGIAATPDIYPFYKRYETTIDLVGGETFLIQPRTSYVDNTNFGFIESFESANHVFRDDLDNNDSTNVELDRSDVFEGSGSGRIFINQNFPAIEVGGIKFINYPPSGTPVYVEMDYKADVPMAIGWVAYDAVGNRLGNFVDRGVNSKDTWNKVYFNFRETIREIEILGAVSYQMVLVSTLPIEDGAFALDDAEIMIDNVKVVRF